MAGNGVDHHGRAGNLGRQFAGNAGQRPTSRGQVVTDDLTAILLGGGGERGRTGATDLVTNNQDLVLDVTDRPFISDLKASTECCVNLPCGEIYCAPNEGKGNGVLVVDGPVGDDGLPPMPLRLEIKDGRCVNVQCEDLLWQERIQRYMDQDEGSCMICEVGMGLNPGARLVGRMLEDEKALRTAHVAFGDNQGFPGGVNRSGLHVDFLVHLPTVLAERANGSVVTVLKDGDLVI